MHWGCLVSVIRLDEKTSLEVPWTYVAVARRSVQAMQYNIHLAYVKQSDASVLI